MKLCQNILKLIKTDVSTIDNHKKTLEFGIDFHKKYKTNKTKMGLTKLSVCGTHQFDYLFQTGLIYLQVGI